MAAKQREKPLRRFRFGTMVWLFGIAAFAMIQLMAAPAQAQSQYCFNNCGNCVGCCADEYAQCAGQVYGECPHFCDQDFILCIAMCGIAMGDCDVDPGTCERSPLGV